MDYHTDFTDATWAIARLAGLSGLYRPEEKNIVMRLVVHPTDFADGVNNSKKIL
jgi:hypothetical protein